MSNSVTGSAVAKLLPIDATFTFFEGDDEVVPGITSSDAAGHTPGSTVLELSSGEDRGLLIGDIVHSVPELLKYNWDFFVHNDYPQALETICRFRGRIVRERLPFAAAHFPGLRWTQLERNRDEVRYRPLAL